MLALSNPHSATIKSRMKTEMASDFNSSRLTVPESSTFYGVCYSLHWLYYKEGTVGPLAGSGQLALSRSLLCQLVGLEGPNYLSYH